MEVIAKIDKPYETAHPDYIVKISGSEIETLTGKQTGGYYGALSPGQKLEIKAEWSRLATLYARESEVIECAEVLEGLAKTMRAYDPVRKALFTDAPAASE